MKILILVMRKQEILFMAAMIIFVASFTCVGEIIRVPNDYLTIQEAVDAAGEGDEVLIGDGTYTGIGNKNIDLGGRAITIRSENGPERTIIDCQKQDRAFSFISGEESDSVLSGFTIINGDTWIDSPISDKGGLSLF